MKSSLFEDSLTKLKSAAKVIHLDPALLNLLKKEQRTVELNIPYRKELCKKHNIKMVVLDRHCPKEYENISTTKIIEKIKNSC